MKPLKRIGLKIYKDKGQKVKARRFCRTRFKCLNLLLVMCFWRHTTSLGLSFYKAINEVVDEMVSRFHLIIIIYILFINLYKEKSN